MVSGILVKEMRLKTIYFVKINMDYWLPTDTSKEIIKLYKLKMIIEKENRYGLFHIRYLYFRNASVLINNCKIGLRI